MSNFSIYVNLTEKLLTLSNSPQKNLSNELQKKICSVKDKIIKCALYNVLFTI